MVKKFALAALCASSLCGTALAGDARTVIADAQTALGNVRSIVYSGSARDVAFQQCGANAAQMICYGTHDPMRPIHNYVRVIDLEAPTSRHAGDTLNIGGGASTTLVPGRFFQQVTPEQANLSQPWGQSLEFYITPWGFLKGAAEQNATASRAVIDGEHYTILSWSPAVKAPSGAAYRINGYVNEQNLIDRVETWLGENILGDMHILVEYSDWMEFNGTMAPSHIVQTRGGWPFFEVHVTDVQANLADLSSIAPAPEPQRFGGGFGAQAPGFEVIKEQLGEGVFRYTTAGFSYDSLVVEFADHIMMLEAGQNQARAQAYVDEIKQQFPGKPIRYVMVTHPHSDHTGGLPVLVAEGATIIAHENAREFLQRAFSTPRTLLDDALSRNPRIPNIETVSDMRSYSDGNRTVEFYHVYPAPHSDSLLIAYLPKEKVLFQGDFSVNAAEPANDHVQALVATINRLGLDYDRYINVHASPEPQSKADIDAAMSLR